MGNLQQPREALLFNSITAADFNTYLDTFDGHGGFFGAGNTLNLLIIKHGVTLTYPLQDLYFDNPPAKVICNKAGKYQGVRIELNPECPCEECDYSYGVTVREILHKPGVFKQMFGNFSFYGGKLEKIECTYGLINDSYLLTMETDIITQCAADVDGPVYATRVYVISDVLATTTTLVHTSSAGALTTLSQVGAHTAQQLVDEIISHAVPGLVAYRSTETGGLTDYVTIEMGLTDPTATLAISAGASLIERSIGFVNKTTERKFEVKYDDGFATAHYGYFFSLTSADWTNGDDIAVVANDNLDTITGYATLAAAAVLVNAGATTGGLVVATTISTTHLIIVDDMLQDTDQMDVYTDSCELDSAVVVAIAITPDGLYEYLINEEIRALFINMGHHGRLTHIVGTQTLPIDGQDYCKITFKIGGDIYAQHGAGHVDKFVKWLDLYVPKDCDAIDTYFSSFLEAEFMPT